MTSPFYNKQLSDLYTINQKVQNIFFAMIDAVMNLFKVQCYIQEMKPNILCENSTSTKKKLSIIDVSTKASSAFLPLPGWLKWQQRGRLPLA